MKKRLQALFFTLALGSFSSLFAQCYGVVHYDSTATAGGLSTFNIVTSNANELILIAYNGWDTPGSGPVKVDGNPATHINTAHTGNAAVAEVYCYSAPAAGTHTIVCTETGYTSPYYLNFAASFYVTGTCLPLSCSNLITTEAAIGNKTVTDNITTTTPNEIIYCSAVSNTGKFHAYAMTFTGATRVLGTTHIADGIDAADAYTNAPTIGTYTVSTFDNYSCCGGGIVLVAIVPPVCGGDTVTSTTTQINPTCGSNNGSATVIATGGGRPYTYLWTPSGQTDSTATGLSAGTYTVYITNSCGYRDSSVVTLTSTALTVTANVTGNEPCNGNCVGSAAAVITGGTAPFTYAWTPTGGTNATATGLCAGTYTISVTDKNGCHGTASVTITQPLLLTATIAAVDEKCFGGNNATATVTASGGTVPYTYLWNPGGQTNSSATGLSIGSYTVTVTDNNGCTATASITITQPPQVTATMGIPTNVLCNGANTGSATVTAGGGTPNYTYLWTPSGQTNATATGLSAGTYTVTITDANGCTATASVTITQPTAVTATISSSVNILCNGGMTGSASVLVSGGTPAYTYNWMPGGNSNASASGMSAGTYTVTVTDANGCTATASVTLTQPANALSATTSFTQATCNLSNGSATVIAGGGTPNYTYVWNPGGNTNSTATGLAAGSYTVTVTDANGCIQTAGVTVTQPNAVNATIAVNSNVSCNGGSDGSVTVSASGGTAPYTYLWTPSAQTNATATGLSAGTYTAAVTDNNGCVVTATISITEPSLLTASIGTPVNVSCNGGNNGSALLTAGGGTPNYTYQWTPAGGTNAMGTGLSAGTYTATVTDANGCSATASVTITEPAIVTATMGAPTNVNCNGGSNGSATVTAGGGTPLYTYQWSPIGGTNATGTGLSAGTYTATVTDANGCSATATVTITEPTVLTASTSFTQASCNLSNGSATAIPAGGTGPYTYVWTPSNNTNVTATGLSANSYTVTVTDNNGCIATASVTVTQPSAVTATITSSTNIPCNGGSNGTATVTAAGGSAPYTYQWTPTAQTNAMATGLSAGTYTATVTDANGCIITASVTITQPTVLTATMSNPTQVLCNGGNNGAATVTAIGGTSPYNYSWTPAGGTNATGTGLTAGSYTATVTDANGCSATATVTITQPAILSVSIGAINNVKCNGQADGSATATATGGVQPYVYAWTLSGGSNAGASGLSAGVYTITVTDFNGCTATASTSITQPGVLSTTLSPTNVVCYGSSTGSITSATAGGSTPYKYLWSNGQITANATNLSAGSYTLTVTDANNCTATASVSITVPSQLTVTATGPQSVCSGAPANLSATATGGTPPYVYNWTPSGGTGSSTVVRPIYPTTYTITVTDANGCTAIYTVPISVNAPLSLTVSGVTSVCPGSNITLVAHATGGDGNYTYTWLPSNQTTQTVSFSPTKDTVVTIELNDGCNSTMQTLTLPIRVNPTPYVSFAADITSGCKPLCIQFSDLTANQNRSSLQRIWSFGNGDTMTANNPFYCYNDTGSYSVTLTETSDSGCSGSLSIVNLIHVYAPPVAAFNYSPNQINILNPQVQFTDQSSAQYKLMQWYWRFEQGSDSINTEENPLHTYQDTGTYCATLVVVDLHGCVDSVTQCLVVNPVFTVYIPDAFTPNGDGINDVFMPKGSYVRNYEMYIYDRWGQQLFHSTDMNNGWNGTVDNGSRICQEDIYVYLINITDSQGNNHSYSGKLNLLK